MLRLMWIIWKFGCYWIRDEIRHEQLINFIEQSKINCCHTIFIYGRGQTRLHFGIKTPALANTLDFYVHARTSRPTVRTVLRRLMAAESTYNESLVSARYVEEAKKGNRARRLQEAKTPYLYRWAET